MANPCDETQAEGALGLPRDYFEGPFLENDSAPVPVRYTKELARNLRDAIGPFTLQYVARKAGVRAEAIAAVLSGSCWPDLVLIAKLEHALGTRPLAEPGRAQVANQRWVGGCADVKLRDHLADESLGG
mgnify:CR=1 FL=1